MLQRAWALMDPELTFPGAGVWDPAVHPPALDLDLGSSDGSPSHSPSPPPYSSSASAASRAATATATSAAPGRSSLPSSTAGKTSAATTPGSPRTGTSQLFERLQIETPDNRVRTEFIQSRQKNLSPF